MTEATRLRTCNRHNADGAHCGNLTTNADSWCRQDGCDGFRPDHAELNPGSDSRATPLADRPGWTGISLDAVPIDSDEAYEVGITKTAIRAFVAAHGGTDRAAEAELRSLLEDMLRDGKAVRRDDGTVRLSMAGYKCMLSPDGAAMTHYGTVHAERSWSQVKAGVPSRVAKFPDGRKLPDGYVHRYGPVSDGVPVDAAGLRRVDARALRLTTRVIRSLHRLGMAGDDDASTLEAIAPELAADLAGAPIESGEFLHVVSGPSMTWKISTDGTALVDVKQRAADGDA